MNKNIMALNIDSEAFDGMKKDFDKVLKRTLGNMQVKESEEAVLNVKLAIKLTETIVPDFDSEAKDATKKVHKPSFTHKVSSVMQIKTEESGSFKGEYELVWDEEAQDFVMKPIDNGQGSLFDEDGEYINVPAEEVNEPEIAQLPENHTDYEYEKVEVAE